MLKKPNRALVGEGDKESDGEREREMKERGAAEQEAG